jgi:hypothetical protein
MRNPSTLFKNADALKIHTYYLKVLARQNPESLNWTPMYSGTGRPGSIGLTGAAYGWENQLEPNARWATGDATVTAIGDLVRSMGVDGIYDTAGPIYINRVAYNAADVDAALQTWTASGKTLQDHTRESITTNSGVRMFRISRTSGRLVWCDSTNAASTWGADNDVSTDDYSSVSVCVSSPDPHWVFTCMTIFGPGSATLQIVGYHWNGSTWIRVAHPRPMNRVSLTDADIYGHMNFATGMIDVTDEKIVVVYQDGLAGRPASCLFWQDHWSDQVAVEAIDFGTPERDTINSYRLLNVGFGKTILTALRMVGDSDFIFSQQAVLYYTPDGVNWSEPYYIEGDNDIGGYLFHWWGNPQLWKGQIWLVGADRLYAAPITTFFGGGTSTDVDITPGVVSVSVDEPEDRTSPVTVSVTLQNEMKQYLDHPSVQVGGEIEVQAGYPLTAGGSEYVSLFTGVIGNPAPTFDADTGSNTIPGTDYSGNLTHGQTDRSIEIPQTLHEAITFDTDAEMKQMGTRDGEWVWMDAGGEQFVFPIKKDNNTIFRATGVRGEIDIAVNFYAQSDVIAPPAGSQVFSLLFSARKDWAVYYIIKWDISTTTIDLYRNDGTGEVLISHFPQSGAVSTTWGGFQLLKNKWYRITVRQDHDRIFADIFNLTDVGVRAILFDILDLNGPPLDTGTIVAIQCTLPEDNTDSALTRSATGGDWPGFRISSILLNSHDYYNAIEDFVFTLGVMRGFDTIWSDSHFWSLMGSQAGLTKLGSTTTFTSDGTKTNMSRTTNDTVACYLDTGDVQRNLVLDLDVIFQTTNSGIAAYMRSDFANDTFARISIWASTVSGIDKCAMCLETRVGGVSVVQKAYTMVPLATGKKVHLRFVAVDDWYMVFVNQMMAGVVYDNRITSAGTYGFGAPYAMGATVAFNVDVYRMRCPFLGVGELPAINPAESIGDHMKTLLDEQGSWLQAQGRTMYLLSREHTTIDATINGLWLSGGYTLNLDNVPTHIRVVSTDSNSNEISGTAYSPMLWKLQGRPIWHIENVDSLPDARACRIRAWQFLREQERAIRQRSYSMHPSLLTERNDVVHVINEFDETDGNMIVVGLNRSFTVDEVTGAVSCEMTTRLDERDSTLDQSFYYDPFSLSRTS